MNLKSLSVILIISAMGLIGCDDTAGAPGGQDCRSTQTNCPIGTVCQPDPLGAFYCGPANDMNQPGADSLPVGATSDASTPIDENTGGAAGEMMGEGGQAAGGVGGGGMTGAGGMAGAGGGGAAGSGGQSECGDLRLLLKPSPGAVARVYVVVDRSYSMIENVDRWTPVTEAIAAVTQALGGVVQFGLVLFPNPFQEGACAPGQVNVPVAHGTSDEIVRWLTEQPPEFNSGTPTAAALQAAGEALSAAPTENDYILLATDGGPGCNFALDPQSCVCLTGGTCVVWDMAENCLDRQRTVTVVRNLFNRSGIRTFVLGLTDDNFLPEAREVLDEMAVTGMTAVDGRHFEIDRLDTLQRQLTATAGGLVPCRYDLSGQEAFADQLNVSIDGQMIPRDPNRMNGWSVQGAQIEFHGEACQTLRDGRAHEVRAECR